MDLKKVKKCLEEFNKIDGKNINAHNEYRQIDRIRGKLEWNSLTDSEKQNERRYIFAIMKKGEFPEVFTIETTIIELYDLCEKILPMLESFKDKELAIRLNGIILAFMFNVNEQRKSRDMDQSILPLLYNLIREVEYDHLFSQMFNILKQTETKLENLISLFEKEKHL